MTEDSQGVIITDELGRRELRHLDCLGPDETISDPHPGPLVWHFCQYCWVPVERLSTMDDYLSEVEATSHAGHCAVCYHELVDPVPESVSDPIFLHAAFYSTDCRWWWLCADHEAEVKDTWLALPHVHCQCEEADECLNVN